MEASVAAAAAAVVDLSGQLLKAKHEAQQSGWHSQLKDVLQQQHSKLLAWGMAQVWSAYRQLGFNLSMMSMPLRATHCQHQLPCMLPL